MKKFIPVAMTIAGSDSGGGAGIEADLKTFAALGVHGTVAITSVTAQNTYAVTAIYDLPPEMVVKQIETVAEDMGIDAAKTGMLSNAAIIEAVAKTVKRYGFPLVVDPVMIAKSGAPLLRPEAVEALVKHLIPLATIVTPNRMEAEKLSGIKIETVEDAKRAAKKIVEELGPQAAIVKGGHIEGDEAVDVLYYNGRFREFRAPRVVSRCTHGTGCSFSAAITAELAKGQSLEDAIATAKRFITMAIEYGIEVGKGHCPVNPMAWLEIRAHQHEVIENVYRALDMLVKNSEKVSRYVPEVGMNIAMAMPYPYAKSVNDVAGVEGRVVRVGKNLVPVGRVRMGGSKHVARVVLEAMKFNPEIRAALNVKYESILVEAAKRLGYVVVFVDRREEPEEIKRVEGASIPWMVDQAFRRCRCTPDVIYDEGDVGKEPMIRILGKDAVDVVNKLMKIIEEAERLSKL